MCMYIRNNINNVCTYNVKQLHLGVVRDNELQERRRIQNLYYLEQQNELTKQLRLTEKRERDQQASA
ncbi:cytochrome c oxidase assembly factor-like isoform X2 [Lasioglossum baleicum]|uniref:cytochrome c oxidase assembly factor-like isoform X2 n=1 Tax=Lasioglossum baleicum TaxID=434251 RepID=UPI003FCEC416